MRALLRLGKDKSALSNIVAYVLLISITVALSVIVYGWLRFYVSGEEIEECSEDVNIIIRSYECFLPSDTSEDREAQGRLNVALKNKGLFTVDGYVLRVHDRPGATFGFYIFDEVGTKIKPGEEHIQNYYFNDTDDADYSEFKYLNKVDFFLRNVTLLEVQPFMMEGGEISCKSYSFQEVKCLGGLHL